ncbi:hypothetical protein CC86DRAFT_386688 [Ophiobolus disseminans]|uniref:Uncharacterized protein n=1 Tax=Ophiobolus disseminans TaxID=1469910 RepID=A0A6A6ZJ66_9PLEO|nr:hypothetical protein CC86DRAFT_386688 [Ophiobolus disseminans]
MRFGCCASRADVDDGREALKGTEESQMQVIYDQPQVVQPPRAEPVHHPRPSTSQSMGRHVSQWVNTSRDFATRASSRASFSTLTRPRRSHSVHKVRPSISQPSNFQRFDNGFGIDSIQSMVDDAPMPIRRNRSLRRLELSIYLPNGRLSPLPDFEDDEAWGARKVDLEKPEHALVRVRDSRTSSLSSNPSTSEYLIQRKPVASSSSSVSVSHSRRSSTQSQKSNETTTTHERRLSGTTMATMQTPTLSAWPEEPTSAAASIFEKPTIRRSLTSGTLSPGRVLSRLPSPSRNRANTAPNSRPGSLRRARTDVDDAIRELNTIVEERRASAYRSQTQSPALINRPPPSPSHHVPYIAPSMRMHVRSETLSDIGSAFSAPVTKILPITPARRRTAGLTLAPPSRDSTMALCSNPITPPAPHTPTKSLARITTWIKRSMSASTTPTSPSATDAHPFYQCEPLPTTTRPSTAGSHTLCHTRQESQDSNATATVTLFSASSRSQSPTSPPRKTKRVPAPLVLAKEKEIQIEVALKSGRSIRELKPPSSPHANLLKGMEISARDVGVDGRKSVMMASPGAVGVAF